MSKELEELKIIRQSINDMLDKGISMDGDIAISLEKRLDLIEAELKVLEIIKPYIEIHKYEHMNSRFLIIKEEVVEINKETYDLLKEELE